MTLLADHLVGRAEELGLLDQVLAEIDQGRAAAIELVGEPGIGKTRLLAELSARADAQGSLVLSGSASELERDLPFSVFVDALDEYLHGLDPSSLARLDEDVRTELAHVFPSLATLAGARDVALQHERYRSHRAVRALLEHLAGVRPLVLVLDDLHWADSASVELVGALLRRPPAAAVLMALAHRPRGMPERLSAALERAHREGALARIELGALSAAESQELLGEAVSATDAAVIYAESGGNPFYLEQLARSLDRLGGTALATEILLSGVPSAVAASLGEELTLLSANGRLVLEGAAVAGDPFEPELAAPAAATSEAAVMEAVDELLQLDLVRTTDVPRRFRFRHPLVRRAVYESTAAGWRLGAHERCAQALAERGAPAAARAHHVQRSAREGDLEAVAVLREAGEAALRLAPMSAAHWFADSLRLLPPAAPAEERIDLLVDRAGALTAAGHYALSHHDLLEAIALVPDDAHALRARLARRCAGVETLLGRHEEAGARMAAALESLPDRHSREAVALMIELARNHVWRAQYDVVREWAERAVEAARQLRDGALTAGGLAALALALGSSTMGSPEQAEAARSEAADLVDSASDHELSGFVDGAAFLGGAELYLDRYADADRHAGRALELARATGQGEPILVLIQTVGAVWRQRGKLADAADLLDGGIEAARVLGNTHALVWGLSSRSSTALRSGDVELALALAAESVELSRDAGANFHSAEAAADLAAALLETGDPGRAADLLIDSCGGEELTLIAGSPRGRYLEVLTRSRLALDRHAEARRAADCAEAWAAAVRLPMAAVWAQRAAAAVDLHTGDPARAARRALVSAATGDDVGAPVEAALSRVLAGRALAEAGEIERAVAELEHAARELEARGALRHRDEAERELRKLGQHIHRRSQPGTSDEAGIASLTERELQLARLVVDRKTNPEIAAELFLSKKTVETHLRNIFRKVGVSSRVELARAVERADRAGEAVP
jgi:DNA-binding NarL/FixJ family response regulator